MTTMTVLALAAAALVAALAGAGSVRRPIARRVRVEQRRRRESA